MKSFVWKGIPVNIPDTRTEWIFLVYVPLAFVVLSLAAAIFSRPQKKIQTTFTFIYVYAS
ncbi:MAG: hypothetical protein VX982_02935 [Chloroflexota bacterium]|nr:hypothetical protein [Chloroflexota bacterium]